MLIRRLITISNIIFMEKKRAYEAPEVQMLDIHFENTIMQQSATGNIDDWEYDDDELDF